MRQILKIATLIITACTALASQTLLGWYDPTGRWGACYPSCYYLPPRGRYTVRAEFLYLRPHTNNLKPDKDAFVHSKPFKCFPNLIFKFNNDERKRRFKWNYGWRVGIGFACNDCWEADLNWTHYQSKNAHLADFRGAETKWKVHLDMVDLEIGKEMWFRRCFRLKPHLGLRVAQIKQRYRFEIDGFVINPLVTGPVFPCLTPGFTSPFELFGTLRHNYLALGPRAGFDAQIPVGCGFHVYVTGAAAWLWGEMQNRYRDNFILEGDDRDNHWEGSGTTDFSVGLGWSDLWWHERRRLTFRFGYEHHWFIHETKFRNEGGIRRRNQTSWFVQGVAGSITCDF